MSFTDSSVASVIQPASSSFNVAVLLKSADCFSSNVSNLSYFISDSTEISVPACIMNPSNLPYSAIVTLNSIGTTSPPAGFATLAQNPDNSYKITISSNDVSIDGQTYTFLLSFSDTSVA